MIYRRALGFSSLLAAVCLFGFSIMSSSRAANTFRGGELYAMHCERCHGADGRGAMPGVSDFRRGRGLLRPDTELFDVVSNGKGVMPGFQGVLRNREILDVLAYIRTLR